MRAIVVEQYGKPEELQLREMPRPLPGAGQILVRLEAAGVNPVDTYLRAGAQGYAPKLPFTPGMDGAGTVEAVGKNVQPFTPGARVYVAGSLTGTYAEYCLASPEQVFPLPKEFDFAQGACLGVPYFTAARALSAGAASTDAPARGAARALSADGRAIELAGKSVLIHGASGGVGTACLQLAAGKGGTLLGTAGSEAGRQLIEDCGARSYSHYDPNRFDAMRNYLGGSVDLIIEMLANVNLNDDMALLAPKGRIVVVGSRGHIGIAPRDLMRSEGSIHAVRMPLASGEERQRYAARIQEGAIAGHIKPLVARRFPLEDAAAAHEAVINGPHCGNLVLEVRL